jgi:hypothetical protein
MPSQDFKVLGEVSRRDAQLPGVSRYFCYAVVKQYDHPSREVVNDSLSISPQSPGPSYSHEAVPFMALTVIVTS